MKANISIAAKQGKNKNTTNLYFQISMPGHKREYVGIKISVPTRAFNLKLKEVVPVKGLVTKNEAQNINLVISNERNKIERLAIDCYFNLDNCCPKKIKELYQDYEAMYSFTAFFEKHVKQISGTVTNSTLTQYRTVLMRFKDYIGHPAIKQLSITHINEFDRKLTQANLSRNTRSKYHKIMKAVCNAASREFPNFTTPYTDFKHHRIKGNRTFLTKTELKLVHNYYKDPDTNSHHKSVLDYFIFSCLTGVRFGDIKQLHANNIQGNVLEFLPEKTKRTNLKVQIPLPPEALAMVQNRRYDLFQPHSEQVTNRTLKEISAALKINKHITYHTSRHTFGTLFLQQGGKVEVLQQLMGHSKIETTMIYVKIADESKATQMQAFNPLA